MAYKRIVTQQAQIMKMTFQIIGRPPILYHMFKTSWKILLFLLCLTTGDAFAQDKKSLGQDIVTIGKVKAVGADKKERAIARGDLFYVLDTILVDVDSKAQLRFSDGGLINLIALTEFRVDSYVFKEPNQKSESVNTLIKGGFRAISGSLAKENIAGTQIKTPLAVIGLRGTLYEALLTNGKLFVGCFDGMVAVTNAMGEVEIGPHSNTLYAMVEKGKAPLPLKKIPDELAAVSFEVPGGEPMVAPAAQVQVPPKAKDLPLESMRTLSLQLLNPWKNSRQQKGNNIRQTLPT